MIAICRHNIRVHNIELLVSLQSQLGDETREWNVVRNNGKWKMWLQQGGKTSITALGRHFMSKQSQESFAKRRQAEYKIITFIFQLSFTAQPFDTIISIRGFRCRGKIAMWKRKITHHVVNEQSCCVQFAEFNGVCYGSYYIPLAVLAHISQSRMPRKRFSILCNTWSSFRNEMEI